MIADSGIESGSSPEINSSNEEAPMSRTHQYRKVMKPLLERKRRARINKCLDNLKDIMVNTLQSEGESITKLEKADVLELTVKHLRKLKRQNALGLTPQATYAGRFRAGYSHCAQEVSKFMSQQSSIEIDTHASARLLSHLSGCIHALESMPPSILTLALSPTAAPNSLPSPISPPLSQGSRIPPSHFESMPKSIITSASTTGSNSSPLISLSSTSNPTATVSLSKNNSHLTTTTSNEYANSLAMVAATAQQYSALLQNTKNAQNTHSTFTNNLENGRLNDSRLHPASGQLSSLYSRYPVEVNLEEYRRALTRSSSVLCGIDDKAWRPW